MFGKDIFEEALGLYAGPHVVERVRKNKHAALQRSCEEADLILLVQDVRPFTSFSESMTPARLQEVMCEYLDLMTECVEQCGGIVDHIRGESIVAYWESLNPQRRSLTRETRRRYRKGLVGEVDEIPSWALSPTTWRGCGQSHARKLWGEASHKLLSYWRRRKFHRSPVRGQ